MLPSILSSSCPNAVLYRSRATVLLIRSHRSHTSPLSPISKATHLQSSRSFSWWRRRHRRIHCHPLEARFWGDQTRSQVRDAYNGALDSSTIMKEDRSSGSRNYSDGNSNKDEREQWRDRRARFEGQYRHRMDIWRRMLEEDPYNTMFGASNAALKGKGWANPFWNSIPKWMQEELEMTASKTTPTANTDKATPSGTPSPEDKASSTTKSNPDLEDLENPERPIEVPRMRKSVESVVSSAHEYDPISGRMIAKGTTDPEKSVNSAISTQNSFKQETSPATNGLPNSTNHIAQENYSTHPPSKQTSRRHYRTKLDKLPKDDIDFVTLDELRSKIGYLRQRVDNISNEEQSDRPNMELSFEQVQKDRQDENIQKPTIVNTSGSNDAHITDVKNLADTTQRKKLSTTLERCEQQDHFTDKAMETIAANEEPDPVASIVVFTQELLEKESALDARIGQCLHSIAAIMEFDSEMELSKLDDARAQASKQLDRLQEILDERAQQLETGHFFEHWMILSPPQTKTRPANRDARETLSFYLDSRRTAKKTIKGFSKRLEDLKAQLSGSYAFANREELYPGLSPRKEHYGGSESYDIQDMARLVTFQDMPEKTDKGRSMPESTRDSFPPDFEPALADRLLEYENRPAHQSETSQNDPLYDSRAVRSSNPEANVHKNLHQALNEYEKRTDPYSIRPPPETSEKSKATVPEERSLNTTKTHDAPHKAASTMASNTDSSLSTATAHSTEMLHDDLTGVSHETNGEDFPPQYRIIIYDPDTKCVEVSDSTANTVDPYETALYLPHAIQRLRNPAKFLPHITADFEIISAEDNVMIMRRIATVKSSDAAPIRSRINPIDGTTCPLPEASSGRFASPTGYVAYHQPIMAQPLPHPAEEQSKRENERLEQLAKAERRYAELAEGRLRNDTKRGGFSRVLVAGITGATVCYVAGVVGELLK